MTCRKFELLKTMITNECHRIGCSHEKTINYLINKASRKIARAEFDIYDVSVSFDGVDNRLGRYINSFKIPCRVGTLFITVVVD